MNLEKIKVFFTKTLIQNKIISVIAISVVSLGTITVIAGPSMIKTLSSSTNVNKTELKETKKKDSYKATALKLKESFEVQKDTDLSALVWTDLVENKDELTKKDLARFQGIDLENVKTSEVGEYDYTIMYNDKDYTGKIKVVEEVSEEALASGSAVMTDSNGNTFKVAVGTKKEDVGESIPTTKEEYNQWYNNKIGVSDENKLAAGTYNDKGATLVSNGDNTGTLSYRGGSTPVKFNCYNTSDGKQVCDIELTGTNYSSGETLYLGNGGRGGVLNGSFNYTGYAGLTPTLAEYAASHNISITRLSYQVSNPSADGTESFNKLGAESGKFDYSQYDYQYAYSVDSRLRVNGFVLLRGTPLNNGQAGEAAYSWEQIFY